MWYQKDRQRGAPSTGIGDVVNNTAFCPEYCGGEVSINMYHPVKINRRVKNKKTRILRQISSRKNQNQSSRHVMIRNIMLDQGRIMLRVRVESESSRALNNKTYSLQICEFILVFLQIRLSILANSS